MKKFYRKLAAFFLAVSIIVPNINFGGAPKASASVTGYVCVADWVRVRQTPGGTPVYDSNDNALVVFPNEAVTILSSTTYGGSKYYEVQVKRNGVYYTGWLRDEFVQDYTGTYSSSYAQSLMDKGFPSSYCDALCYLHSLHPNWVFTPYFAGGASSISDADTFSEALDAECELGKSMILRYQKGVYDFYTPDSWLSTQEGAYDPETDTYTVMDSGGWLTASRELVAFYLDPRNFLNENTVFMFENKSYNSSIQTRSGLTSLVSGSFLAKNTGNDGLASDGDTVRSYVDILMTAASESGVSPYMLASRIIQEQGSSGYGASISGTVSGYAGYYNFFNIGAYASGGRSAVVNGLIYASNSDSSSLRPWNTKYKSIVGGAIFLGSSYINRGQLNGYLQKFNLTPYSTYSHQYMGNILAPALEALTEWESYTEDGTALEFVIPVFKNMPSTRCSMPTAYTHDNTYLDELTVTPGILEPAFDPEIQEYTLTVSSAEKVIGISASAQSSTAKVRGAGMKPLVSNDDYFEIYVVSESGTKRYYTINIVKVDPPITPGDLNSDGNVDNQDLLLMRRYLSDQDKYALTEDGMVAADLNEDDDVNNADLLKLRRLIAGQ